MTVTKRKPKPITAHPMFPAVTALWFAAFLGLGSFAIAPAVLEGPVVALGIPEVLPAAAPPLGFTVRAMMAIVMLGLGGLVGYLAGKRLGRVKVEPSVRMRSVSSVMARDDAGSNAAEQRRPLNPVEDLGPAEDFVEAADGGAFLSPRREFAVAGDDVVAAPVDAAPFAYAGERSPLPWEMEEPTLQGEAVPDETAAVAEVEADPLALDLLFEPVEIVVPDALATEAADPEAPIASSGDDLALHNVAQPVSLHQAPLLVAPPITRAALDELGLVQLTERLALAIGRYNARAVAVSPSPIMAVAPVAGPPAHMASLNPVEAEMPAYADGPVHAVSSAPVLTAHSCPVENSADEGAGPASEIALDDLSDGDELAQAAPFVRASAAPVIARLESGPVPEFAPVARQEAERVVQLRPAALQPLMPDEDMFEDEFGEEEVPGLGRFLRVADRSGQVEDREPVDFDPAADPDVAEDRYPSLLDMGPATHRAQALSLSDALDDMAADAGEVEPVVVFPGHATAAPAEHSMAQTFQPAVRPFERPHLPGGAPFSADSIIPVSGSPLAAPGRAAPSAPVADFAPDSSDAGLAGVQNAEEADRALRAALATLQRMTAQG